MKATVFYRHCHSSPSSLVVQPFPVGQQGRQQDTAKKPAGGIEMRDRTDKTNRQMLNRHGCLQSLFTSMNTFDLKFSVTTLICHATKTHLAMCKTVKDSQLPHFPHCWHQEVPKTQQRAIKTGFRWPHESTTAKNPREVI